MLRPDGPFGSFSSSSTKLAEGSIAITAPRTAFVGASFRVEGTAVVRMRTTEFIKAGGEGKTFSFDTFVTEGFKVAVRVGDDVHQARVSAQGNGMRWFHDVKAAGSGEKLRIGVELSGTVTETQSKTQGGQTEHRSETKAVRRTAEVNVTVDADAPELTTSMEVTIGPPYRALIEGTAEDASGVKSVRWRLNATSSLAENLSGDWSSWRAVVPLPDRDQPRTITVFAEDAAGNVVKTDLEIEADDTPPSVAVIKPEANPHLVLFQEGGITVPVEGLAVDVHSKLLTVRWRLDDGPEEEAEDLTGDWSMWRLLAEIDKPGVHKLVISATDMTGKVSEPSQLEVRAQVLA